MSDITATLDESGFLTILKVPDTRLRKKAVKVRKVDNNIRMFMDNMLKTMYEEKGCGLASIQVGEPLSIIVFDVSQVDPNIPAMKMANPEISWHSKETYIDTEGCLSIPGFVEEVKRFTSVKVHYLDENNKKHEIETHNLLARCLQHEIDHLNGKLYIDYLSYLKKQMIIKKLKKRS
ncbi:MAG: peptide deformylase [Alphaproteobacteria bacterium]